MLSLGSYSTRIGSAAATCGARRERRGLLPACAPLKRTTYLHAKRGGRGSADADGGNEGASSRPAEPPRGGREHAHDLDHWREQVAQMTLRELQNALDSRGLPASGKKQELQERLADLLWSEQMGPEQGPQQASDQLQDGNPDQDLAFVLSQLDEVPYTELKRLCSARGLSASGKKAELQTRLAEAIVASGEDLAEVLGLEEAEEDESSPSSVPSPESLFPELLKLSAGELRSSLEEFGAPTSGSQPVLARRLAELMVAEAAEKLEADRGEGTGDQADEAYEEDEQEYEEYEEGDEYVEEEGDEYEEEEGDEYEEEDEEGAEALQSSITFDPASLSPADHKRLIAAEAAELRSQYDSLSRQQIYTALKKVRGSSASYQSKAVMLDQVVRTLSERKVEEMLQAATTDSSAAAQLHRRLDQLRRLPRGVVTLPPPGAEDEEQQQGPEAASTGVAVPNYELLSPRDIRSMKVEDLRAALQHFGMDSTGNKYDMVERLLGQVNPTGIKGRGRPPSGGATEPPTPAAAASFDHVLGMTVRSLRSELHARGLPTEGTRLDMQTRLIAALRKEAAAEAAPPSSAADTSSASTRTAPQPSSTPTPPAALADPAFLDHLSALSAAPLETRAAFVLEQLATCPDALLVLGREAPVDVAVVAGCPPGRLDLAQQSLDAARSLLDQLYTAVLPTPTFHWSHLTPPPPQLEGAAEEEGMEATGGSGRSGARRGGEGPGRVTDVDGSGDEDEGPVGPMLGGRGEELLSAAPVVGGVTRPQTGAVVAVWWLDGATGAATRLSPAQVYGATAIELATGCLPAVHKGLLAVPPASPLSLDTPTLEAPVAVAAEDGALGGTAAPGGGGVSTCFPDVTALAVHLRDTAHVVFPALPAGGELYGELQRALAAEGVPHVGTPAEVAEATQDRLGVLRRLEALSYPVMPTLELALADVTEVVRQSAAAAAVEGGEEGGDDDDGLSAAVVAAAEGAVREKVAAWCREQGLHPDRQLLLLRPRHTNGAATVADAATALGAERVAARLARGMAVRVLADEEERRQRGRGKGKDKQGEEEVCVVVEPVPTGASVARFVCTVVETPDGPVALLPSEVELYDTEAEIAGHAADVAEWNALRQGADDEEIAETRASILAREVEPWRAIFDPRFTLPAITAMRLHTPPRLSRKLTHAIRHSAARLFGELGLRDMATVEGWVQLPERYREALAEVDEDEIPILYDPDPYIVESMIAEEERRLEGDPAPLLDYYDVGSSWHADLTLFDPATRLLGTANGEGATVRIASISPELPLHPRHPAVLQAAELGLPHAALLRNLANNALRRAAEAGNPRALTPSEPYASPQDAVEAAAEAAEQLAAEAAVEGAGKELVAAAADAAANAAALAEVVQVGAEPLQLPMPPQLPLYHSAVLQHLREAEEYDTFVESMDPDHWDDFEGPLRVGMMRDRMERMVEEETGVPQGTADSPNPEADEYVAEALEEVHQEALDAAVEALGDFGAVLSSLMTSQPLEDAVEADAEIPLVRTAPLPAPDEVLPDGKDGTAEDPRMVAGWQMAAICELARRHGWEVVEAVDAEHEAEERAAAGVPEPTPEETAAAASAAAEEQLLLEAMCEDDDEVMELRTGIITPVQLYLRFRARHARRPPASHPLLAAADTMFAAIAGEEQEDEEAPTEEGQAPGKQASITKSAADPVDELIARAEAEEQQTPVSTHTDPSEYTFNVPPDDAVELPINISAGLIAASMAVEAARKQHHLQKHQQQGQDVEAAEGEPQEQPEGALAAEVVAAGAERLSAEELEALAVMELGYRVEPMEVKEEGGSGGEGGEPLTVLAAVGPSPEQPLLTEVVIGEWGRLAEHPSFRPLAAALAEEGGLEGGDEGLGGVGVDGVSRGCVPNVDWEDEDAFGHVVAAASASASGSSGAGRLPELEDEPEPHPAQPLVEAALAAGDKEAAELAAAAPGLCPTRVWVVVGGDGHWGREAGLVAGWSVMAKLGRYQDLVVEPFLMVPHGEGRDQEARRTELLRRRTEYVAGVGMDPQLHLPESMQLSQLRAMPPVVTGRPETHCMYAVTMATVSRPSVPEALSSLERTAAREGIAVHALTPLQRQQREAHEDTQAELAASGLEGVASLWDGNVRGQPGPPPARPLDLATFAEDAAVAGAVVLVAARGEMAECGNLQALLELNGVPYVGPGSQQLSWLWDRTGALQEMLQDLSPQGVDAPPRTLLPYNYLETAAELDEEEADELWSRLQATVLGDDAPDSAPLLVRPAADVAACGVARLSCGADLVAYATAIHDGDPVLPSDTLSYPHPDIRLPQLPPPAVAFEPFVAADPLLLVLSGLDEQDPTEPPPPPTTSSKQKAAAGKKAAAAAAAESGSASGFDASLRTLRSTGWLDVSFTLLGPLGRMTCLPPAMRAAVVAEEDVAAALEADAAAGGGGDDLQGVALGSLLAHSPTTVVAPPPEDVLSGEVLEAACQRAVAVADRLGLRGLVQIEAFVAADSGDLVVYDVNGNPDLGPDSSIYRQAAAAGLLPTDLLRQLLGLAIEARASPEGQAATYDSLLAAQQHASWDLEDEIGEAEDVDTQGGLGVLGGGMGVEDGMLGELEEMRVGGAVEEDGEEEVAADRGDRQGGRRGGRGADRLAGMGSEEGFEGDGGEAFLDFEDQEGAGAAGGIGGGYMGLGEFGASGSRRGGSGRRGRGGDYEDEYE